MREIFYELIEEAAKGKVMLFNHEWPIGFNTKITEDGEDKVFLNNERNLSVLYIKDEERFFDKLEEYLKKEIKANRKMPGEVEEKERLKYLMAYLFVYATTEDFINPVSYIQKRIDFLEDHTFDELEEKISISLEPRIKANIEIMQETNPISMETPKKMVIRLRDSEQESSVFPLPNIYYAIHEDKGEKVCYIYSLLKPKEKNDSTEEEIKFQKKMNRLLFKLNDGLTELDEYNSDSFLNIKDVSMPFIFCLNIFVSLLQRKGIERVKAVPYLPVCYLARELTASASEKKEELRKRNQQIQDNQTKKFIRTFKRLSIQNPSLRIDAYPYEVDEFLTMKLIPRPKEIENMLLEESSKRVTETISK
ncbi:MAG: hypothetical protein IKF71_02415 [Bacilli bacterium]|nr:hypothetical protein [Bacilli bacterium]